MKRLATDWEKIFAKHISDKGLIYIIHKEPFKLSGKKTKQPNLKMSRRSEQTSLQRRETDSKEAYENMFNIICH